MGTRRVHTYAASFGQDLAKELIEKNTSKTETVLDPFMGAGTGVLQSLILDRKAIGIDVDPVACLIVRTMGCLYQSSEIEELNTIILAKLDKLEKELSFFEFKQDSFMPGNTFSINGYRGIVPDNKSIVYWFAPVQRAILSSLVAMANEVKEQKLRDIVRLAISSAIIRKWPNTLSLARDIDHSRPHRTERQDLSVNQQIAIFRNIWKVVFKIIKENNANYKRGTLDIEVYEGDACVELGKLKKESVDYILTSPPYFNAIDYPRAHKYAQWWISPERRPLEKNEYIGLKCGGNIDNNSYEKEIKTIMPNNAENLFWLKSFDSNKYTALCRYIFDLNELVKQAKEILKSGKNMTLILANNKISGNPIPLSEITKEIFTFNDLEFISTQERLIEINRRRYPYGLTGFNGLLEKEFMIHATKP